MRVRAWWEREGEERRGEMREEEDGWNKHQE